MSGRRDWLLLGPAYGEAAGEPARGSQPLLQKFGDSKYVTRFLADPRSSLPFGDEDLVYLLADRTPPPSDGSSIPKPVPKPLRRTSTRKLYLDAHHRFYVVVVELHCDGPGLPNAPRDAVCEAGFVVRRRRVVYPLLERKRAERLLLDLDRAEVKLSELAPALAPPRVAVVDCCCAPAAAVVAEREPRVALAARQVAEREAELRTWIVDVAARTVLEGWLPDPHEEGVGAWQEVAEEPGALEEQVFPLYPLVADPRDETHPARGRSLWFGVVPTASADHERDTVPRLDASATYEIRCFVRRHDPRCPKRQGTRDCRGPLVWSARSEQYRLADRFDLIGTSNKPITVQMPDLPLLLQQMRELPRGPALEDGSRGPSPRNGGMPLKFAFPERSQPSFGVSPFAPIPLPPFTLNGGLFCFQPIPLVTVVALFVFTIFKKLVVTLFQLQWLDVFICLPSGLDVDAALLAKIGIPSP